MKKNLFFVATAFFLGGAMMSFDGGAQTAEQQIAKIVDSLSNDFLMKKDIECKTAAVSAAVAAYEASKTATPEVVEEPAKGGKTKPSKTTKPTSTGGASTGGTTGGATNNTPTPTPTPTNDKAGKMSGDKTSTTTDKKDKMSGDKTNATQDKKDKMNKGGN